MICRECEEDKPIHAKGLCRNCYTNLWRKQNPILVKKSQTKTYKKHAENRREYALQYRRKHGVLPYNKNKTCSQYLGIHISERILSNVFEDVTRMPFNHPGYDFICKNGYKIDVKSSCLGVIQPEHIGHRNPRWSFMIRKNKIVDYFLCLAFDNRNDLNPMYVWLIPGKDINTKIKLSIATSKLSKWDKYKLQIDDVLNCCSQIKKGGV